MLKFFAILLIQILCGMELDLFIPSFPELQNIYGLSPAKVQLMVSVNFVAFCICSLFAGALGDKYNRRTIILLGLGLFVLGSLICVLAPNFEMLLMGRLLQGIGMAAPAILSFPVLLEAYDPAKQAGVMGMINGVKTLSMACAPVIGSFVNYYFSWRGNFTVLLGFGLLCLAISYLSIPNKMGNKAISLSLMTYLPLLKSRELMIFIFSVSLLTAPYWMFIGMAPILYMENLGVSLKHFGYYQGSLSLTFAIFCIFSPLLLRQFGQHRCLKLGMFLSIVSIVLIVFLIIFKIHQPILITATLLILSIGVVFPINILYPFSLEVLPDAKGRSAGLSQAIVLLLTASFLELVAYFYQGAFKPIGITMVLSIVLSLLLINTILQRQWLSLREST